MLRKEFAAAPQPAGDSGRERGRRGRASGGEGPCLVCSALAGFAIRGLFGVYVCVRMRVCEFHPIYNLESY